jgi:hypothetical protein
MSQHDDDAIAAFIRSSGVTRCPTSCVAPTQAVVAAADRLALSKLAEQREVFWEAKREARVLHRLGGAEPRRNTSEEHDKASRCGIACMRVTSSTNPYSASTHDTPDLCSKARRQGVGS